MRSIVRSLGSFLRASVWILGLEFAAPLGAQLHAPTASFSYTTSFAENVDIPGIAYGPNGQDEDRLWVSAYCPNNDCPGSSGWGPGSVREINPSTGTYVVHGSLGWGVTGPAGLAHDGDQFLWVAGYNDQRLYRVRVSNWSLAGTIDLAFRPVGGLGIDGAGRLWVSGQSDNMLRLDASTGAVLATYPNVFPRGGIDCIGPYVVVVWTTGLVEVRDMEDFDTILGSYSLPPANDPGCGGNNAFGDLGIDRKTGFGYWGGRCEDNGTLYRVKLVDVGPSLTSNPQNATRCVGTSVTFSVTAFGDPAVQYQWWRGNSTIAGATSSSYTIPSVQPGDDGVLFRCRVSNVVATVESGSARLTVTQPPTITSTTGFDGEWRFCVGETIALGVTASGTNLSYLWERFAPPATFTTLGTTPSITYNVTNADVGLSNTPSITCRVSGTCGPSASAFFGYYAEAPPQITQQPQSATVFAGSPVTFSVVASGADRYQWLRNGTPITGARSSSYTFASPTVADNGARFRCELESSFCPPVLTSEAVLTVLTPFGAPTGLTGCNSCSSCGPTGVALSWNAVSGATHYQVYRSTSSAPSTSSAISTWITATSFQDTSAPVGVRHFYWVKAAASASGSLASGYSASTTGWRTLPAPTGVSASDGFDEVYLFWNAVPGANFYRVHRNHAGDPAGVAGAIPIGDWTNVTFARDVSCLPNETYLYWVLASVDSVGDQACAFSVPDPGWRDCVDVMNTYYGTPPAPGMIVLLDRSASMNVVRPSTGNPRHEDALTMAYQDVSQFFTLFPFGSVAVWVANGECLTDRTQGFETQAAAEAVLDQLALEPCEGTVALADALHTSILKLYETYSWTTAGQRILAVSSAGVESSSTGPCSGPDATRGVNCTTGFVYDPNPALVPWQQKVCDLLGNPTLDVIAVRMWDALESREGSGPLPPPGPTAALFASLAERSGGSFQRIADDAALPPSFLEDCNENGIPDYEEIATGLADCNQNGALDECDIASGASHDGWPLGGDGIPDECQRGGHTLPARGAPTPR